jgi:hypothetical protein
MKTGGTSRFPPTAKVAQTRIRGDDLFADSGRISNISKENKYYMIIIVGSNI